jgi:hypothetical protein
LLDPFGRGTFVFRNNGTGMFFGAGCSAQVNQAMVTVQNNGTGILADAADTLSFATDQPNGSAVTGNETDVDLKFGTLSRQTSDIRGCSSSGISRASRRDCSSAFLASSERISSLIDNAETPSLMA